MYLGFKDTIIHNVPKQFIHSSLFLYSKINIQKATSIFITTSIYQMDLFLLLLLKIHILVANNRICLIDNNESTHNLLSHESAIGIQLLNNICLIDNNGYWRKDIFDSWFFFWPIFDSWFLHNILCTLNKKPKSMY